MSNVWIFHSPCAFHCTSAGSLFDLNWHRAGPSSCRPGTCVIKVVICSIGSKQHDAPAVAPLTHGGEAKGC